MGSRLRFAVWVMVFALFGAAPRALQAQDNQNQQNQPQAQDQTQNQDQNQAQGQNQAQPQGSDQSIVDDINAKLFADSALKTLDIRVSCQQGVVVLRGSVDTQLERAAVDHIASYEPGVVKVIDSLAVGNSGGSQTGSPAQTAQPAGITVPAGTVVTIRTIDSIDSSKNRIGQEFTATIEAPVAVGSQVVIPQGSTARLRLANSQNSGRVEGSAELELELASVTVNGTTYPVQSGYYQQHGASRGQRTGAAAGGGAVLGALIGAIAGGGKGAAIGAGSGAAIGAGTSVAMKGSTIKVPPETKIDFTLRQPVTINSSAPAGQ